MLSSCERKTPRFKKSLYYSDRSINHFLKNDVPFLSRVYVERPLSLESPLRILSKAFQPLRELAGKYPK